MLLYGINLAATLYSSELESLKPVRLVLLVLGLLFSGLLYYSQFYRPLLGIEHKHLRSLFEHLFEALSAKYKNLHPGDYGLRINVMKARRRIRSPRTRFLRFDFHYGDFSEAELEQEYANGVACCGSALAEKRTVVFDADKAHEPYRGMTHTQREVTRKVKSIISIPIFRNAGKTSANPIAILSLDSFKPVDISGFFNEDTKELAKEYAELASGLIP